MRMPDRTVRMRRHRPPALIMEANQLMDRNDTPPNMPGNVQSRRASNATRIHQLLTAVCRGDEKAVERLATGLTLRCSHPGTGCCPLSLAVIHNQLGVVTLLLRHKTLEVDARDNEGRTALHYAAAISALSEDLSMYYLLAEAGAKDTITDGEGFCPLDVKQCPDLIDIERVRHTNSCQFTKHTDPIRLDLEWDTLLNTYDEKALLGMVRRGELNLSFSNPPTNDSDTFQKLAHLQARILGIWDAISLDDERTVKQLLCEREMGLVRDKLGRTALHMAYRRGRKPIIDYLLQLCPEAANVLDKKGRRPSTYAVKAPALVPVAPQDRRGSRTRVLHHERFHSIDGDMRDKSFDLASPEGVTPEVMARLNGIKVHDRGYEVLEQLQMEGKADQIWRALKRNIANDNLARHVSNFRRLQARLSEAVDAVEKDDMKRLKQMLDADVVNTRDTRGMRLLHICVLRERHEMAEYIVNKFPHSLNLLDQSGRTAAHYAAVQPNAIYDTLVELGVDTSIVDADGHTASSYRQSPDRLVRPASTSSSSVMLRSCSTDDEFFDPGELSREHLEEF